MGNLAKVAVDTLSGPVSIGSSGGQLWEQGKVVPLSDYQGSSAAPTASAVPTASGEPSEWIHTICQGQPVLDNTNFPSLTPNAMEHDVCMGKRGGAINFAFYGDDDESTMWRDVNGVMLRAYPHQFSYAGARVQEPTPTGYVLMVAFGPAALQPLEQYGFHIQGEQ